MRIRVFVSFILLILFVTVPLYCYGQETTTHNFNFKGYYRDTEENVQTLKLSVFSRNSTTDRIYHSGDITIDDRETVTLINETTIFNWILTGENIVSGFTLSFSITPLQAYQSGLYFIPKHTYTMYKKNDASTFDSTSFPFAEKMHGNYPYPGYRTDSVVTTAVFSYSVINNSGHPFNPTEEGYCTLQVIDYDTESAVNFTYISHVTVEFTII